MRLHALLFGAAAMCSMGAHESRYGISRFAMLSSRPDTNCIRTVLDRMSQIRKLKIIDPPARVDVQRFRYEGNAGAWAYLTIRLDSKGHVQCLHERLSISERPPADELEGTYRLMLAVEQKLATRCGISELPEGAQEEWFGVSRTK